jgi:REP element-mobilizing transposase RayT
MNYDPGQHQRRSIRLKSCDYSQNGAYFFTVCVDERECLLGEALQGTVHLSNAGQLVLESWESLPNRFAGLEMDAFVVMPNHIHGLVVTRTGNQTPLHPKQPLQVVRG